MTSLLTQFNLRRVIVAGGRDFEDYERLTRIMNNFLHLGVNLEVVCGMARGADSLGKQWADENNILVHKFPADWSKGNSAGIKRNIEMANFSNTLIAFWDRKSRGTDHMIQTAKEKGLDYKVYLY